ncbi:methyltransferase domain-containing protein [Synechococcus sp. UW86]|uniref:methyltransferase domain-containing protein n=1 Tax=Synechococcus sp. UW86 TaxID=368491 RepID=UPI0010BD1A1F|nr:class I SAM-dependent methyltransferase [Synechococcus sp. UW86]
MSMSKPISDQQLALNRSLHEMNPAFGNREQAAGVAARLPLALLRMHQIGLCSSVLDYGTGKGLLTERLRRELPESIRVTGYDPAVEKWSSRPDQPHDILTCLDVLEHVDIDTIDTTLKDIQYLTNLICYVVVDLQPAVKQLSDGRNAHILLAPAEWWVSRFSQLFPCVAAFPIKHKTGQYQKIVIACTKDSAHVPHMYSFLNKLNVYNLSMKGGSLKS